MEERSSTAAGFESAAELREVLERLLFELDDDDGAGSRLGASRVPHRFVFPDRA